MPILTEEQRQEVWRRFMELGRCPGTILKADARAAVNAIDDFLESNATAINVAFPQPFRNQATTEQKAFVVAIVALRRAGISLDF